MRRWLALTTLLACNASIETATPQTPPASTPKAPAASTPVQEEAEEEVADTPPAPTGPTAATGDEPITPPASLTHYVTGDPSDASIALGDPALILMGGGTDVDAVFSWAATKVPQGDVVILRASGADGYNDYLYTDIGGFDSVETLIIDTKVLANDAYVKDRVEKAELIFMAGGDQSVYTAQWRGTKLVAAVASAYQRGAIVGGTSAGAMVLSDPIYTGENGSAVSADVLPSPFADEVTLAPAVFPLLERVLVDTHFAQRARLGRLLVFLARSYSTPLFGVGIDEKTALVIETGGNARVIGTGKVHVVSASHAPEVLSDAAPLTYRHLPMKSFSAGATLTFSEGLLTDEVDCIAGQL